MHGGVEVKDKLLEVMQQISYEGAVVQDWRNAEIVPITKKGNFTDNWRGISLSDVVGKVMARVLPACLQVLAERVLPESQCGFKKGRGCADMIFASRQLVEKCKEHDDSLFILIDLKKGYDLDPEMLCGGCPQPC